MPDWSRKHEECQRGSSFLPVDFCRILESSLQEQCGRVFAVYGEVFASELLLVISEEGSLAAYTTYISADFVPKKDSTDEMLLQMVDVYAETLDTGYDWQPVKHKKRTYFVRSDKAHWRLEFEAERFLAAHDPLVQGQDRAFDQETASLFVTGENIT